MAGDEHGVPRPVLTVAYTAFVLVLGAVVGLALADRLGDESSASASQSADADANDLIVMSAGSARVTTDAAQQATLQLRDVDSQALWFTDRPQRSAGSMLTDMLVANWPTYFASSQPNAAIVHRSQPATRAAPVPVILADPTPTAKGVRFTVTALDDAQLPPDGTELSGVRLFIDPPAARLTDFHEAPMVNPQVPSIPQVGGPDSDSATPPGPGAGLPAAKVGDQLTQVGPPDSVIKGSTDVQVDGLPDTSMPGPATSSGSVQLGNFNVMVGG